MGRVFIHLHGKPKDKSKAALIQMYSKRLETESVKIVEHNDNLSNIEYVEKLQDFSKNGQFFFFEEKGSEYDSIEFSNLYRSWKLEQEDTHLAIGPAEGFPQHSFSKVSLSKFTILVIVLIIRLILLLLLLYYYYYDYYE